MDTKRCCLLIRYQENCHSQFASPTGATGQVHTLSALRCNISHNRHLSTKHLTQGYKHAVAWLVLTTYDGLVIMSPALIR